MTEKHEFRVEIDIFPEVYVDEKQWTSKEIKDFNDTFYDAETIEDIAKHALEGVLNLGEHRFIEGFGYIKVNGSFPVNSKESERCTSLEITNLHIDWDVT